MAGEALGDPVEHEDGRGHAASNLPAWEEEGRGDRRTAIYVFTASVSAFQGSRAHLMRTGNFDTPARARSSPSVLSRAAPSSPCIMALIRSARASAWGIDLSLTSCVIIEAAAWLIEQPRPMKRASLMMSSSTRSCRSISSPHSGLLRSEEHTSELQSRLHLVCRLLLEKKKKTHTHTSTATTAPT